MSEKLSVILICKNEEKNIRRCLESLDFSDEIILVDSGSTDQTLKIAGNFTNIKIFETQWLGYSKTKQFAVEQTKNNWILWIDADEVVSKKLREDWTKFAQRKDLDSYGAILISRKTFFLGHFVKHSGWYPENIVRFFHKNRANFNENILHEGLDIQKQFLIEKFSSCLLHYSYHSLTQYFQKMNNYGYLGAQELIRKNKSVSIFQIFLSPFWSFFKSYFLKKGFLDGLVGITICIGSAFSCFIKYTNYFFLKKYGYVENTHKQN